MKELEDNKKGQRKKKQKPLFPYIQMIACVNISEFLNHIPTVTQAMSGKQGVLTFSQVHQ